MAAIRHQVLGPPDGDNALLVRLETGHDVKTLLFDCGGGCLDGLSTRQIHEIDALFFSHLHMDHVAGFDHFFRRLFDRTAKPNHIFAPIGSAPILHHRFQGFLWNFPAEAPVEWRVTEVAADMVRDSVYTLADGFRGVRDLGARPAPSSLYEGPGFAVSAALMDHGTPALAYLVREAPRSHVDPARLSRLGLTAGAWLKRLGEASADAEIIVDGAPYAVAELRRALLVETPGDSIAYLTDFLLDATAMDRLAPWLAGCRTIVGECQYRAADETLARRNHHVTTRQIAELAKRAGAEHLILLHLSRRYLPHERAEMLAEAREIFPDSYFPVGWEV